MPRKRKDDCPTEFTLLSDDDGVKTFGRCEKVRGKIEEVQIVEITDTEEAHGLDEGEKREFWVEMTRFFPEDLENPSRDMTDDVEDYESLPLLDKAVEQKHIGLGEDAELGKRIQGHPRQTRELARAFDNENDAEKFMREKLPKWFTW